MHDPLDLLRPENVALDETLRRRTLARTLEAMHTQRRRQRLRSMAALGSALAAGILLLVSLLPSRSVIPRATISQHEPIRPTSAVALEWQALDRPAEAPRLYKEAGDRYMEEADLESALRTYGSALDASKEDALDVSADDNWLLMAIKLARKKENVP